MKKVKKEKAKVSVKEQGMALITTMMCLMLCTSLGLAVLFNSTGEAALSGGFMRNEQAFYAADAGIGIAREAIRKELNNAIKNPTITPATLSYSTRVVYDNGVPYTLVTVDTAQLSTALSNSQLLGATGVPATTAKAAVVNVNRLNAMTNSGYTVDINVELVNVTNIGVLDLQYVGLNSSFVKVALDYAQRVASATATYRYTVTSTGNNGVSSGNINRATANAVEVGLISATLEATIVKGGALQPPTQSFSEFGTFLNHWNGTSVWASGVFQGKVHSNDAMRYNSSNIVTFVGAVTQANSNYIHNNTSYAVSGIVPNSVPKTGMNVNSTYTTTAVKELPKNSFSQELAVLNSSGVPDSTYPAATTGALAGLPPKPTAAQLAAELRDVSNSAAVISGTTIANGIYLPVVNNGGVNAIDGGGIYVKGDVAELKLSISGESQVYAIKQGTVTTTITITPPTATSSGQTVITRGSTTQTYQGVPLDKHSSVSSEYKPGVQLFVDGAISQLHGAAASSGAVPASISKNTSLSITSTSDIQVTGSITYEEPVLTATGSAITYANNYTPKNVLGLFTNSGKMIWKPDTAYTGTNASMTVDAAIAVFNEAGLLIDPNAQTGGWATDCTSCNSNTVISLRGSRSVSKGNSQINDKSQKTNRFFDPRFANSQIVPPFFPSTVSGVATGGSARTVTFGTTNVQTIANTWQRTYS